MKQLVQIGFRYFVATDVVGTLAVAPVGQIVYLINGGHNKVLAAGQDDGNLHLQDLEDVVGELNAQWGFIFLGTQTQ